MRGTKEMMDIMDSFEKSIKTDYVGYIGEKTERLSKTGSIVDGWPKDYYYSGAKTNELFKLFLSGYMAGRCEYMNQ